MKQLLMVTLIAALAVPAQAAAQAHPDVWREVVSRIDPGTEVNVRLENGTKVRATLLEARPAGVLLQPKTRVPVPVQEVPYTAITMLERRTSGGMGAGKAVAIGIASGAGAFLAILGILVAAYGD